jgi:hypothetical protein
MTVRVCLCVRAHGCVYVCVNICACIGAPACAPEGMCIRVRACMPHPNNLQAKHEGTQAVTNSAARESKHVLSILHLGLVNVIAISWAAISGSQAVEGSAEPLQGY